MKDPYPRVEIEWDDAASTRGWERPDEKLKGSGLSPCRSVGYLVRKTKHLVTIVQSRHDVTRAKDIQDYWAEALTLPRSSVRRIKRLQ